MDLAAICAMTFGGSLLGSLLPVINAELLVISMAALAPHGGLPPIVAAAAIGQIAGKVLLYLAGRGTIRLRGLREHARLQAVVLRLQSSARTSALVLFASALAGVPPLYAVSVASGIIGIPLHRFVAIAFVGRVLRFGLLVQVPHMFTRLAI